MRIIGLNLILIFISLNLDAQSVFEKKYSPSLQQYGREIFETSDHGFFLQGTIEKNWRNCYLIKTNSVGDTLWTKTYGTDSIQFYAHDMTKTADGGYLLCGDYQEVVTFASMDSYVQKIDSLGNQVWFNLFGWPTTQNGSKDHAELIKTLDDGSVIVEGSTKDYYISLGNYIPVGQGFRSYLAKFDTSGILVQIKTVSLILDSLWGQSYQALDIETIGNRTYWLGIPAAPYFPNGGGTTLVAFDSNLDSIYTISNGMDDYYGLSKTNNNELLLFGQSNLAKMDTSGTMVWVTPNSSPSFPNEIIELPNGSFASIGGTYHISPFFGDFYSILNPFNQTVYLNKYDLSGNLTTGNVFNLPAGVGKQLGYKLVPTFDNGFAFVGYSDQSIWLVKTDSTGILTTGDDEVSSDSENLRIVPNPATSNCMVYSTNIISEIALLTITGTILDRIQVNNKYYNLDLDKYQSALYFIEITTSSGDKSRVKLVVTE
ncbi:MAG TPA: T9SS type A sorting domain-containing protein [Bacteroidia bacterium]|nr:T9SS type A sorting domain-containing protein [Bacteroidia bacterium]